MGNFVKNKYSIVIAVGATVVTLLILVDPAEDRGSQVPPELVNGRTIFLGEDLYDLVDEWGLEYSPYSGDFIEQEYRSPGERIVAVGDERPNFTYSDWFQRKIEFGLVQYVSIYEAHSYAPAAVRSARYLFKALITTYGQDFIIVERPLYTSGELSGPNVPIAVWRVDECTVIELDIVTIPIYTWKDEWGRRPSKGHMYTLVRFYQDCDHVSSRDYTDSEIYTIESLGLDTLTLDR